MSLDTLNEGQLKGFYAFKKWYEEGRGYRCLLGVGGTGKTHAIGTWMKELGVDPGDVLFLAPLNNAALQLEKGLTRSGYTGAICTTIHKALGLSPVFTTWEEKDEQLLLEVQARLDNEAGLDEESYRIAQKQLIILKRQKSNTAKDTLSFAQNGMPLAAQIVIVDECSMVSEKEWMLLVEEYDHILFMGDRNQCFPVGEGLSPTFDNPLLVELIENMRAESSELVGINNSLVESGNIFTSFQILKNIPVENGSSSIQRINGKKCIKLLKELSENSELDGDTFRYIAYKNDTVDNVNTGVMRHLNIDWDEELPCVANKPIRRWNLGKKKSLGYMITNQKTEVVENQGKVEALIPMPTGYKRIDITQLTVRCDLMPQGAYMMPDPSYPYKNSVVSYASEELQVNVVSTKDLKRYKECLNFWKQCKAAVYSKCDNNTDQSKALFSLIGVDSYAQINRSPGRKRYTKKDMDLDLLKPHLFNNIPEGNLNYYDLRKVINRFYYWVQDLNDPIKPCVSTTVYKSQGCTIKNVFVDLNEIYNSKSYGPHGKDNAQRALYTAVSRAQKNLYIVDK